MRSAPPRFVLLVLAAALIAGQSAAGTELLYNVDFSTPPHSLGALPATGASAAPRKTPTAVVFGDPTVVMQVGALTDQPCSFGNGTIDIYDQLEFGVSPAHAAGFPLAFDEYTLEATILIESMVPGEGFRVLLDCPSVNTVDFNPDATITLFPSGETIGTFVTGVPVLLKVTLDIVAGQWTIWLNGSEAHSGAVAASELRGVRVSHASGPTGWVAVDDIRLYGGPTAGMDFLYNVSFASPPHLPGSLPTVGVGPAPRKVPTLVVFGDPTVVASLGGFPEQPCEFGNGTTGYDQLRFVVDPSQPEGFPEAYDTYVLSLWVLVEQFVIADEFVIHLDAPTVNKIMFKADETILVFPGDVVIGQFDSGVPMHVRVELDVPASEWTIWLNGTEAHSGAANAEMLRAFRLHMDGTSAANAAAVDDVYLWGIRDAAGSVEPPPLARLDGIGAYPNPTRRSSRIHWEMPTAGAAEIEIVSADGRRVWTRIVNDLRPGPREFLWDGRNAQGQPVSSGVYFAKVHLGDRLLGAQRIVLQR